jgi:membrane associated rhomboid family serine protease
VAAPFVLLRVPALIVLGLWFVGQVMSSFVAETGAGGVAFLAHVGGFIGGAILIRWFLRERRRARA